MRAVTRFDLLFFLRAKLSLTEWHMTGAAAHHIWLVIPAPRSGQTPTKITIYVPLIYLLKHHQASSKPY